MKISIPSNDFQLRRLAGIPNRSTQASAAPPAPNHPLTESRADVVPFRTSVLGAVVPKVTVVVAGPAVTTMGEPAEQVGVSCPPVMGVTVHTSVMPVLVYPPLGVAVIVDVPAVPGATAVGVEPARA